MYPDIETYKRLSEKGNVIPVYREILADLETPVSAYLKLCETPSFLFESVEGGEKWGRYSIIGTSVSKIVMSTDREVRVVEKDRGEQTFMVEDPFRFLEEEFHKFQPAGLEGMPRFFGGLVGYVGYDMVRFFERVPSSEKPGLDVPDMFIMVPDIILIFDNLSHRMKILSPTLIRDSAETAYREAKEKIDETINLLSSPVKKDNPGRKDCSRGFVSSFGPEETFRAAVQKAKDYVWAGDVVQVVLSQRFETTCNLAPFDIYRALRVINPSPYMFFIDTGEMQLVGSSPEILVRLEGRKIILRPIAGTRRRGDSEDEDRALEKELREDPKEVAEHIMLVDLGRNDVGRVAETGSVKVTELMTVERYSHVMHLVSNIEGTLRKGLNAFDLFRSCFPAGTVTGAPKVRAMEIIDELEPVKRGPYAGAVGYFGLSGNMDTCITIRTIIIRDGRLYIQAGAGIVADSEPEREYKETVNKAMGMMKAVEMAESIGGSNVTND